MSWFETLFYVLFTIAPTTIVTVALIIVYRRYKKLDRKIAELSVKLVATSNQNNKRNKVTSELINNIINLYRQGYSYRQIAKIVGVSHTTVG